MTKNQNKERYDELFDAALERYAVRHGLAGAGDIHFRAALIDMDGTLYDSMGHHTLAWQKMMQELGIEAERDRFYLYEGMTGKATINLLFREFLHREASEDEVVELYRRKTVLFNEMPKVKPMPGAAQLLDKLRDDGIECVLVTGSGQLSLIDRLNNDFPGIFSRELMITSADVDHGKPDPEPYLKAMARVGVSPEEAFVLENAPLGVRSGARSGAFTIGVTTGHVPPQILYDEGADIVLPSIMQVYDCFSRHTF